MFNLIPLTMAKIRSIDGKMTGKLAGRVYAVRNGEQIIRERPFKIFNPNTMNQVNARARLKMLSQISAVVGNVIPLPRIGSVTPRNRFVKINYQLSSASNGTASIPLSDLKLTTGAVGLPYLTATQGQGSITVALASVAAPNINRVVYVFLQPGDDNVIRFRDSLVVERTPGSGTFEATASVSGAGTVILAYGVIDNSENARVVYGDVHALTAQALANLISTRTLTDKDITLTETRGVQVTQSAQANSSTRKKE